MTSDRTNFSNRDALAGFCLSLAACTVYLRSFTVGFFSDDFYFLGRTASILESPLSIFHIVYRDFIPVVHLSFLTDWMLGGMSYWVYHLSSILIHGLTTFFIFTLCRSLHAPRITAAAATLCWAFNVHISETVIWCAARGHSLATLFLVAALISVARNWRLTWSVALFLIALGAKETALFPVVLLPFLARTSQSSTAAGEAQYPAEFSHIGMLDGLSSTTPHPSCRKHHWAQQLTALATNIGEKCGLAHQKQRLNALIFGIISIAFVLFNVLAKPKLFLAKGDPFDFVFHAAFLILRPLGLDRFYDYSPLALFVVALTFAGLIVLMRRQPIGLFGLLWIAASLVPIALQPVYSSRYFYLPSVGFVLVLCALIQIGSQTLTSEAGRRIGTALGVILLILTTTPNIVFIQREIADYETLSAPYGTCVDHLRAPISQMGRNETLVVLDISGHTTIKELTDELEEHPTLQKLIPYRQHGINGLIALDDLVNIIKPPRSGLLARWRDPQTCSPDRIVVYDGNRAWNIPEMPEVDFPTERIFACTWGDPAAYFDQE